MQHQTSLRSEPCNFQIENLLYADGAGKVLQ